MPPEKVAALIVRLSMYAACALGIAVVIHARSPETPIAPAFAVLLGGIALTVLLRVLIRARHV